jgi:hypothetical protein
VNAEYSKTLTTIMQHWTKPLPTAVIDMSTIEFPFNVETFCREMDGHMNELTLLKQARDKAARGAVCADCTAALVRF